MDVIKETLVSDAEMVDVKSARPAGAFTLLFNVHKEPIRHYHADIGRAVYFRQS